LVAGVDCEPRKGVPVPHIGWMELLIVLAVLLLLFGATRVPRMARSLGQTASEFKKGAKEAREATEEANS